ncbi:hypothetical protein [Diaminobutyricibacter sp. McL0608]|uniref:hypothetical protein n=1 Tax=Leifsonia sp. McL0608 TaxID=3143537 RepID=UPI0031F2F010
MPRLRPKVVLWLGIGLLVASLILSYAIPGITYARFGDGSGPTGVDGALVSVLTTLLSTISVYSPFLGSALVGASIVMFYIAKNFAPAPPLPLTDEADGPVPGEPDAAS